MARVAVAQVAAELGVRKQTILYYFPTKDDLITEVSSQVRSLSRQRKRAERHTEITERRFNVDVSLAAREMEAWRDELARLEIRVADLREQAPGAQELIQRTEAEREGAQAARSEHGSAGVLPVPGLGLGPGRLGPRRVEPAELHGVVDQPLVLRRGEALHAVAEVGRETPAVVAHARGRSKARLLLLHDDLGTE